MLTVIYALLDRPLQFRPNYSINLYELRVDSVRADNRQICKENVFGVKSNGPRPALECQHSFRTHARDYPSKLAQVHLAIVINE